MITQKLAAFTIEEPDFGEPKPATSTLSKDELDKKIKAITKKLRQIEQLQSKTELNEEESQKVNKKSELEAELKLLRKQM